MPPADRLQVPEDCLARCRAGDKDAFQEFHRRTATHVHRILHRLAGGSAAELDDAVQEAYLALWRALPGFRGQAALSSFVYGVCLRVAQHRGRSWFRRLRLGEAAAREPREEHGAGPERALERAALDQAVQRTLAGLSFRLRSVLVLFEMEELSGKEIAAQLGIPEKTVWTRLHHARKEFRRSFPWYEIEGAPPTAAS
ncbi:MAG TPA: sigma-70 family RNA polymerase sigma factor [Myxococcota bacterium]|nr:sigma-70 family RNA polymerase sigma factor [Myxococcota bacterium]HRY94459.1 sigma-70 family RNA polymerase sigma factor [Myxococcota bacterium]HSA23077.1 sigma-70 family RNA polymerase sigma factor [Myxococcota bacterium]